MYRGSIAQPAPLTLDHRRGTGAHYHQGIPDTEKDKDAMPKPIAVRVESCPVPLEFNTSTSRGSRASLTQTKEN